MRNLVAFAFAVGALMIVAFYSGQSQAAEIRCLENITSDDIQEITKEFPNYRKVSPGSCATILIHGRINAGDAKSFEALVSSSAPGTVAVHLISRGGSLADAIAIGRVIRQKMISTFAPTYLGDSGDAILIKHLAGKTTVICRGSECVCASSCFLVWLAGVSRAGDNLWLHRPYIAPEINKSLSYQESKTTNVRFLREIKEYLREMEVPDQYFDVIVSIPSHDLKRLSSVSAPEIGEYPPSVAEWLASACGSIPNYTHDGIIELLAKTKTTKAEQAILSRWHEIKNCEAKKIMEERIAR